MNKLLTTLIFLLFFNIVFCQKTVIDESSPEFKEILNLVLQAEKFRESENFNESITYYHNAIQKLEQQYGNETGNYYGYGVFLSNLANLYVDASQYDKALPLLLKALKNGENTLGKNHYSYGTYLNNLASLYLNTGQYYEALPLLLDALKNTENTLGKEHPNYGNRLGNLASLYLFQGKDKKALLTYKRALENTKESLGENHANYGIRLINLGFFYKKKGQYDKALVYYNDALQNIRNNYGENHSKYGELINNLATLYESKGEYKKAFDTYNEAIEIIKKSLGEKHSKYGSVVSNLGGLYLVLGYYHKALPLYLEAKKNAELSIGENHPNYGTHLNNLGVLYDQVGQYEKALPLYIAANDNIKNTLGKNHQDYDSNLVFLALSHQNNREYNKALFLLQEFNKHVKRLVQKNFAYQTAREKEKFIQNKTIYYFDVNKTFNYITNNNYSNLINNATNDIVTSKGLLLNASKNILNDLSSLEQEGLNKKIANFRLKKTSINKQLQLPVNQRSKDLGKVQEELTKLERELVTAYSKNFGEDINYIKNYKETLLKDNELAIEFTNFRLHNKKLTDSIMYVAYLYKKGWESPKVVNLFEEKQLKKYLTLSVPPNKLYKSRGGKVVDKKGIIADSIYNLVWKPLEPYTQNASAIYYSPDGLLHKIPFAVLPNKENKLLGERYNLNQMGNTADVRKNNKIPDLNDVLLIGGVDYNYTIPNSKKDSTNLKNDFSILQSEQLLGNIDNKKRSNGDGIWDYLEGTDNEVKAIKALLSKSKILTKNKATEKAFKSLSGNSPSVLHIATHGYFFPNLERKKEDVMLGNEKPYIHSENPLLRSGLILANANYAWKHGSNPYEEEDGILTALEISNLNLRNTDIVILSACETGLGDIPSSEGVYGLQRAFKMAGVDTIIMSLWEVPDEETAEFMNLFYTKWKATNNPKKAFKETQRIMMNRYRNDPEKWAAFVYFE